MVTNNTQLNIDDDESYISKIICPFIISDDEIGIKKNDTIIAYTLTNLPEVELGKKGYFEHRSYEKHLLSKEGLKNGDFGVITIISKPGNMRINCSYENSQNYFKKVLDCLDDDNIKSNLIRVNRDILLEKLNES